MRTRSVSGSALTFKAGGLETEDGASPIETAGQVVVAEDAAADRMHEEERPARPRGAEIDQRRAALASRPARGSARRAPRSSNRAASPTGPAIGRTALRSAPPAGPPAASGRPGRRSHPSRRSAGSGASLPRSPRAVPRPRREGERVPRPSRPHRAVTPPSSDDRPCRKVFAAGTRRSEIATGSSDAEACRGGSSRIESTSMVRPLRRRCRR